MIKCCQSNYSMTVAGTVLYSQQGLLLLTNNNLLWLIRSPLLYQEQRIKIDFLHNGGISSVVFWLFEPKLAMNFLLRGKK